MTLKILDITAGRRGIWFDKSNPLTTFVDSRPEVNPDFVADIRALPAEIGDGYTLICFDPPHVNFGAKSNMSKDYGHHTTEEIRDIVGRAASEVHRVSSTEALMAFKWNDHDQPLAAVLARMSTWWEPLFGTTTSTKARGNSTYWVLLRRKD